MCVRGVLMRGSDVTKSRFFKYGVAAVVEPTPTSSGRGSNLCTGRREQRGRRAYIRVGVYIDG